MYSHAPNNYDCPFCHIAARESLAPPWTVTNDIVYQTDVVMAFIGAAWWPNNAGHVIVIPNAHIENIYTMPPETHQHIYEAARKIAIAFKRVYHCDGTSTRQHNELAGYQEIWHYHLHVFPRYRDDNLYMLTDQRRIVTPDERLPYAEKLRGFMATHADTL